MSKENKMDISRKQQQDYEKSLSSIIKKVEESKHKAITTVNKLLIELYWYIGKTIIELQERSKWGDGVVEKLSQDLRMQYPDQRGFSARNLWDCKRLYLTYKDFLKLRTLFAEISWSHNLLLLNPKFDSALCKSLYINVLKNELHYISFLFKEHILLLDKHLWHNTIKFQQSGTF